MKVVMNMMRNTDHGRLFGMKRRVYASLVGILKPAPGDLVAEL
jgi:hypothetical protein